MAFFAQNKNIPVRARVSRAGRDTTLVLTPDHNGRIGVYMRPMSSYYQKEKKKYGFFESFAIGFEKGISRLFNYAGDMKYVFTREGMQSLGGFMSIGSLFPYPFDGQLFWEMTAFLSVILAFMNILPIPALDGGHAMFILYEMVTKKKPSENFLMKSQMIGMMILFFLLIFANLNDVFRMFF
jgi:regulator of sigma E protease